MHAYLWYLFFNKGEMYALRNFDQFIHFLCVCRNTVKLKGR